MRKVVLKWNIPVKRHHIGSITSHLMIPRHFRATAKVTSSVYCRAMKTKGMVFRYMWVYSKEDTMAQIRRPVVTSQLMVRSAYEALYKVLMIINDSGCRPYGMASALIVIGVSAWYPDIPLSPWKKRLCLHAKKLLQEICDGPERTK